MTNLGADDSDLWGRAVVGDGQAFGQLFDRHHGSVRRHAVRILRSPADADDVTAIAFLELWRRRASVTPVESSVLPWLIVTTTYAARNVLRTRRRYEAFLARLPRPSSEPDLAEHAFADELTGGDSDLAAAFADLSLADQQLLSLVVLQDLAVGTAAQVLGLSLSAAKSRLLRARRRLREHLVKRAERLPATSSPRAEVLHL